RMADALFPVALGDIHRSFDAEAITGPFIISAGVAIPDNNPVAFRDQIRMAVGQYRFSPMRHFFEAGGIDFKTAGAVLDGVIVDRRDGGEIIIGAVSDDKDHGASLRWVTLHSVRVF